MRRALLCLVTLAALAALPAFAGVGAIESGIDVWSTDGDGSTFVDFAKMPIPKGFFCDKSAPFTGRIVLRGRPLATGNPNELGGADTIVQRLDRASFDAAAQASTRIQLRALQLEGVAPLKTACGDYLLQVVLNGTQPVSRMRIIKETPVSGRFVAPIRVNFKMTFTPVAGLAVRPLEVHRAFYLQPATNALWTTVQSRRTSSLAATVAVDTDGDRVPDTLLPKSTGNFLAGVSRGLLNDLAARAAGHGAQKLEPATSCSTTVDYGDYGSYGCHGPGTDPNCHPHTEATGVHCSRACAPCEATFTLPD